MIRMAMTDMWRLAHPSDLGGARGADTLAGRRLDYA